MKLKNKNNETLKKRFYLALLCPVRRSTGNNFLFKGGLIVIHPHPEPPSPRADGNKPNDRGGGGGAAVPPTYRGFITYKEASFDESITGRMNLDN